MRAWVFQDHRQKEKLGDKAPWSAGWVDPEGKRRSKRIGSKSMAEKYARKKEGQLAAGLCPSGPQRVTWQRFRKEWEEQIASTMIPHTKGVSLRAVHHFERIIKPVKTDTIKTQTIDIYKAKRRQERGKLPGSVTSPATLNKELRHLKTVLRKAHEWGYLPTMPKIKMVKEPGKLVQFVTTEHFGAMYKACDLATRPAAGHYTAADWWRGLLTFAYMTGWRIREILALKWDDVSLDGGYAITWHDDNKGKRDERVPLHAVVVEHLRKLVDFGPLVFPWPRHDTSLWADFRAIQKAAGIELSCHEQHEHSDACGFYGFHDLRRGFATENAENLGMALQAFMRHKCYTTTQKYINMARQAPADGRKASRAGVPWPSLRAVS